MLPIGICSYSFHRLLAAGKQDIFQFIRDCKALGCTHLDPWNGHLPTLKRDEPAVDASERELLARIRGETEAAGLKMGCVAVDGAHIWEPEPADRTRNRNRAIRWIEIARLLGAAHIRIDAGGTEELADEQLDIMISGYQDLLKRTGAAGVQLLIENHWGMSQIPKNLLRLLSAVPDLGLLLDSFNWKRGTQTEGWLKCAPYAKATHIKTFAFTASGEELTTNIQGFCDLMKAHGFTGPWGVESCPVDGDEMTAARLSMALLRKHAA